MQSVHSMSDILKRLYSADTVRTVVLDEYRGPFDQAFDIGTATVSPHPVAAQVGTAAIAVVTTVAALEWLRRRKAAVAAAEGDEQAYRELLGEFVGLAQGGGSSGWDLSRKEAT